jgi:Skp family chaperone for outer membrane proteins
MRKHFLFIFLAAIAVNTIYSQSKGSKVGFIDMEYILQNVTSYSEANAQLEQKAEKWKQEIEAKKIEINKAKEALNTEKALLTKGLIEERETEIKFLENEMLDFQQKRFGANGDLIKQKSLLVKPIQDQVFTAVQDIAEAKKYDFVFDKSSDLTMLFAANRFDISDQVLRVINRAEKREQLTKKQLAAEEEKENKEDATDDNPFLSERQKALDEKKSQRDKIIEERKLAQEQKKKEYEERRQKIIADREAKKNGTVSETTKKEEDISTVKSEIDDKEVAKTTAEEAKQKQNDAREKALEDRKKIIEDRKKALEERRIKILQERDSIKKARIEKLKTIN